MLSAGLVPSAELTDVSAVPEPMGPTIVHAQAETSNRMCRNISNSLSPPGEQGAMEANLTNCRNISTLTHLPREMTFNDDSLVSVIAYCVLFVIAAFGNLTVFITLFRNRHRKSRVNLFIMHLNIADLIVTFVMLPLEIGWHITVYWRAGDVPCRVLMFCRAFGFYLSSFILVTISLDRYFAILHPLSLNDADKRGKLMLALAWLFSFVASIPQSVIFHIEKHPMYPWYTQCVTFNFFPTAAHELAYNLFNVITIYGLPLVVIIIAYSLILIEMSRKTKESREEISIYDERYRRRAQIRRSGIGRIEKARIRTLKMTIVIVLVFILCWTPYFVISAWWWFDKASARRIDPKVQRGLFLFAVSNSCMDPIVYGMFTINFVREFRRCCCWVGTSRRSTTSGTSHSSLLRQQINFQRHAPLYRFPVRTRFDQADSTKTSESDHDILGSMPNCGSNVSIILPEYDKYGKLKLKRQMTPPHIAHGRGIKDGYNGVQLL